MGAHTGTSPLTQRELIAEYFMEHRVQVLELAAFLDRLERAREIDADDDFRLRSIRDALAVLAGLEEFREHLGGRLTIMLLERIGSGFEVHRLDEGTLLEASDLLRRRVERGERTGCERTPVLAR